MRGVSSVAVVVLVGCTSGPKPPAAVESSSIRPAPAPSSPAPSSNESPVPPTSAAPPSPGAPPAATERRPTGAETRECAARGGTIQPVCMMGELACVVPYRDGGKRCSDKSECTGECLYEGTNPPPPKATGSCQRTSDPCGCRASIHHGHVEQELCAD